MDSFPNNPEHGTIYEPQPGVFYIYDLTTKTWVRTEGGAPGLATPLAAGLMASSDLFKLNRLVVPPPQTTITAEHCAGIFDGGILEFKNGDQFVRVEGSARLLNEAGGITGDDAQVVPRRLHQHTNSFNFTIDLDAFYEYMEDTGKFRIIDVPGRQGPPGEKGEDGKDTLVYGPVGPKGDPGNNAPFDVDLILDPISLERKSASHKAIVGIATESISEEENYLVGYRATIGNINACPADIRISSVLSSTWAVCTPPISDSNYSAETCSNCPDQIYYIDVAPLLQSIESEFDREVVALKQGMEDIVRFWLSIMSASFDEQKAALCCALEFCKSQSRNVETRRYIEQSRITAAGSNHAIVIGGDDPDDRQVTIMEGACLPDGFGTVNDDTGYPNNQVPIGAPDCVPWIMYDSEGKPIKYTDCPAGFTPRAIYNDFVSSNAGIVSSQAAADELIAEILSKNTANTQKPPSIIEPDVAPELESDPDPEPFIGRLGALRQTRRIAPDRVTLIVEPPNLKASGHLASGRYMAILKGHLELDGRFTAGILIKHSGGAGERKIPNVFANSTDEVEAVYRTISVTVDHKGGEISIEAVDMEGASGSLSISFLPLSKGEKIEARRLAKVEDPEEGTPAPPEKRLLKAGICEISSEFIRSLEKYWKSKDCTGVVLTVSSQRFVIVHKVGLQTQCGKGVSIAWPTLDDRTFLPTVGKVRFMHSEELESKVHELIVEGKYHSKVGKLQDIDAIFFPMA